VTCPGDRERRVAGVFKAAPGRGAELIAGRLTDQPSGGDGGPATSASFECLTGIAVEADGGILVADAVARRVRRIGPDGVIRTAKAGLAHPSDVVALPGGAFAVLEDDPERVRLVTGDGRDTTLLTREVSAIAAAPDGALLVAEGDGAIGRLAPDGTRTPIADVARDQVGIPSYPAVLGDPFGSDSTFMGDVAPAPDGGLLVAADFAVHYVPPAAASVLAVALRPQTRAPGETLTVYLRTTKPAQVRIGVWREDRRVALVTTTVPGGDAAVPIPGPIAPGELRVHVEAGAADASASVLLKVLPVAYVRSFIRSRLDLMEIYSDAPHVEIRCGRISARRVDCAERRGRRCVGVLTMRLERNGTLDVFEYDGGPRCRSRGPAKRRPLERYVADRKVGPRTH